jgi:hypothetical protein
LGGGEGGGLVGVGIVDGDVERLVADLPEEGAGSLKGNRLVRAVACPCWKLPITHAKTRGEHARRDDQIRHDVGRHAERKHDRFTSIYNTHY